MQFGFDMLPVTSRDPETYRIIGAAMAVIVLLPTGYTADFVCENGVVVEVKAADSLSSNDEGQLLNYLKASNMRRGLLINFGAPTLQYKRRVWAWGAHGSLGPAF